MIVTMIDQGRLPDPRSAPVSPRSVQLRRPEPLPRVLMPSTALEAERPLRAVRQLDQAVSTIAGTPHYRANSVIERIGPRPDPGRLRLVREQARHGQGTTNCTPPAGPVSRIAP